MSRQPNHLLPGRHRLFQRLFLGSEFFRLPLQEAYRFDPLCPVPSICKPDKLLYIQRLSRGVPSTDDPEL